MTALMIGFASSDGPVSSDRAGQSAFSRGAQISRLLQGQDPAGASAGLDVFPSARLVLPAAGLGSPRATFSPAQMFEPYIADAHGRRRAALRAEDRASRTSPTGADRFDTASVQARRAAKTAPVGEGSARTPAGTFDPATPRPGFGQPTPSGGGPTGPPDDGLPHAMDASSRFDNVRSAPRPRAEFSADPRGASSAEGRRTAAPPAGMPDTPAATPLTSAMAGVSIRAADSADANLAQQVARVVTAGSSGPAESGRVTSAQAGNATQWSAANQKSAGASATTPRPGAGDAGRAAAEAHTTKETDFDRLVRSLRMRGGLHRSSARMHLQPPELGRMLVNVRMDRDELRIDIRTQNAEARALLYERVSRLRVALEQAGIRVDRFEVTADFAIDRLPESGPGDASGADAGVRAHADRREPRDGWPRGPARPAPQDAVASPESEATMTGSDVAEARLDIRV